MRCESCEADLLPANQPIETPRACSGAHQVQEDKTIKHRELPAVIDRPDASRKVLLKVSDGHLAAQQESDRPSEQPERNQQAAKALQDTGSAHAGEQFRRSAVS